MAVSPDYVALSSGFPPANPPLTKTLPSYLYWEYNDDQDIQASRTAFNGIAQTYVDWFNENPLAVYTLPSISGFLLDWVGTGIYGYARPSLPSGFNTRIGPPNTWTPNTLTPNQQKVIIGELFYATTDDVYKRCLTWHTFKGDGKVFTIRWLKRRVLRFLIGENGTAPNVADTRQISISIVGSQVNIGILSGDRHVTGGAIPNMFAPNTAYPNKITTVDIPLGPPFAFAATLKAAIDSGALELPLQYTYTVTIEL